MAERLRQAGVAVETLFIPHVGHGFIGKTPAATRRASLLALRRSFDFIDRITKPEAAPIGIGLPAKLPASVLAAD
jgi:acetyl esterase/lipase